MRIANSLIVTLKHNAKHLKHRIDNPNFYRTYDKIARSAAKSGILASYTLPYIFSFVVLFHVLSEMESTPFKRENTLQQAKIETIDTSSGIHLKCYSYDYGKCRESKMMLEYSTGWVINENNLYQRTVTPYEVKNSEELQDIDKILNMTKDEIDKIFTSQQAITIQKNALSADDFIYDEDAIIVSVEKMSDEIIKTMPEKTKYLIFRSSAFIVLVFVAGTVVNLKSIYFPSYVRGKIRKYAAMHNDFDSQDLETMKDQLRITERDLQRINNPECINTYKLYSHSLRRKK